MTDHRDTRAPGIPRRHFWVLMTIALLSVLVLGSVRFGRIDLIGALTRTADPVAFVTDTVNLACTLIAVAAVLLALRRSSATDTAVWIVGLAVAINWDTLMFAGGVLIDPAVFMFMAVAWLLLISRREWWVVPMMLVAYPLKETALLFGAVLATWAWREYQARRAEGVALVAAVVVGLALCVVVTLYTWISHDLSPRLFFMGVPFAAWLAVQWFDSDAGRIWAGRIRSLPFADRVIPPPPVGPQPESRKPASL